MAANKQITFHKADIITATENTSAQAVSLPGHNRWVGFIKVGTITGTSPTLDVKIQHSADGTTWVDLLTFTQLTSGSANSSEVKFASSATDYLKPLLPFVRATKTVGGSSSPTFNAVTIQLLLDQ
jgi:hypothetical protein